jgi:phospholipase/carboxylesterase
MGASGWTRRAVVGRLGRLAGGLLAAPWAAGCAGRPPERLTIAPARAPDRRFEAGTQPLGLGGERDGVLYLPPGDPPSRLIVMLHGAGGTGRRAVRLLAAAADATGCAVLAPDSRGHTWDALLGGFGPDARFIERALAATLPPATRWPLAVAGFSDGATYALALGRANGEWFSHVLAFSPGFLVSARTAGAPDIFVSHGRSDPILPIDACSRVLVPALRRRRYHVRYREFDGRHEVPPALALEAVEWFANPPTRSSFPT